MRALLALALLLGASPALSGDLLVQVRQPNGAPVPNAVISLYPGGRPAPLPADPGSYRIVQRDMQFSPFVLVVPVGADVSFPNLDPVRHHVYSFSAVRPFELRLYAREQSRSVRFDRPGIVPLGCNIHDSMIAFISVSDTGLAGRTDGNGRILFTGLAEGQVVGRLWHPYLRVPGNQAEFRWTIPASGRVGRVLTVNLRPPPAARTY